MVFSFDVHRWRRNGLSHVPDRDGRFDWNLRGIQIETDDWWRRGTDDKLKTGNAYAKLRFHGAITFLHLVHLFFCCIRVPTFVVSFAALSSSWSSAGSAGVSS